MNRWLACLVVLTGCDALFNLDHLKDRTDAAVSGDGGDAADAMIGDGRIVGGDGSSCIGRFISMCPAFVADYTFNTSTEINTDADGRCNVALQASPNPQICVLAANTITINAVITSRGSRALAFAALQTLTVNSQGAIDVSSHGPGPLPTQRGPAANEDANAFLCNPTPGEQQQGNLGAGGGAAGSFGGTGGAGGRGDGGMVENSNLALLSPPITLRGGCAGAEGGTTLNTSSFGFAGNSGGALYLLAGQNITVNGRLMANGSGGGGGGFNTANENAGGGGGGSGGMIVLDAPTLTTPGIVVAEGGGGGGGAYGTQPGDDGQEWTASSPAGGALGGLGGAGTAGYGGVGSSAGSVSGTNGTDYNMATGGGGGGGGGGAGFTLTYGVLSQSSQFYPAPHSTQ